MGGVRISREFFMLLIKYHLFDDVSCQEQIKKLILEKMDAMERRELYTKFKTALNEEDRRQAKEKYFEKAHILKDFRD